MHILEAKIMFLRLNRFTWSLKVYPKIYIKPIGKRHNRSKKKADCDSFWHALIYLDEIELLT